MWSIARRLMQSWTRRSVWNRSLFVLVCCGVAIQLLFLGSLWREWQVRRQLRTHGRFIVGDSPLPAKLESQMRAKIGYEQTQLFAPAVELCLTDPTENDLAYVASLTHLTSLEIKGGAPDAASLTRLKALPKLATLCLRDVTLDAQALSGLANWPRLQRIKLIGKISPQAMEALKNCESLCEVHLDDGDTYNVEPSPFTGLHLAAIAKIPHLKHLNIAAGEFPDTELRGLAYARELETLTVRQIRLQTDAINILGRLPRLQQLVLDPLNSLHPGEPRALKGFPALKAFSITNARISPAFVGSLAKFPKLEALHMNHCWIGENAAGLADLPKLKVLDLTMSDVGWDALRRTGRSNPFKSCEVFVDEQTEEPSNQQALRTSRFTDYFNQPSWPAVHEKYGGGGGFF